jgi:antitoxin PrlF
MVGGILRAETKCGDGGQCLLLTAKWTRKSYFRRLAVRVTSKGQVTVPVALRRKWGITAETEVRFEDGDRGPVLVVDHDERRRRFYEAAERARGSWDYEGMTTDEYMNLRRGYDEDADDPGFAAGFADRHERDDRPPG